jgi:hypothetical protein
MTKTNQLTTNTSQQGSLSKMVKLKMEEKGLFSKTLDVSEDCFFIGSTLADVLNDSLAKTGVFSVRTGFTSMIRLITEVNFDDLKEAFSDPTSKVAAEGVGSFVDGFTNRSTFENEEEVDKWLQLVPSLFELIVITSSNLSAD